MLPGALVALRRARPGLRVRRHQGRTEQLLALLGAREIDLVVGRLDDPSVPDGRRREALRDEPLAVLARPGRRVFDDPSAAAPARHELLLHTVGQRVGREVERALAALGLPPDATAPRSSSPGFIRERLIGGDASGVMPRTLMLGDLLRGAPRIVPLAVPSPAAAGGADPHARRRALAGGGGLRRRAARAPLRSRAPRRARGGYAER